MDYSARKGEGCSNGCGETDEELYDHLKMKTVPSIDLHRFLMKRREAGNEKRSGLVPEAPKSLLTCYSGLGLVRDEFKCYMSDIKLGNGHTLHHL